MPLIRRVKSLKELCMFSLVQNLHKYPKQEFHNFPLQLSEDLIQHVNEKNTNTDFYRYFIDLFIKPNMKKLRLHYHEVDCKIELSTINLILATSKSLTCLTFDSQLVNFPQEHVLTLVSSIPNIVELNLHTRSLNDNVLKAIGDYCPALEILSLKYSPITDDGIHQLCQSRSRGAKIKYLTLQRVDVSPNGCLLALQNLKQLRVMNNIWVQSAFMYWFEDYNSSEAISYPLKLSHLNLRLKTYPKVFLNFVMKLCPNLTNFELEFASIDGDISLSNDLPIIGSVITKLSFLKCDIPISVGLIGSCCPNIRQLEFLDVPCWLEIENCKNTKISFTKLRQLEISNLGYVNVGSLIPIPQLKWMLRSCFDLEELIISRHQLLTDDDLIDILHGVNPLSQLKSFELSVCNGLTKVAVIELLKMENNLQQLTVYKCFGIKKDDLGEINTIIKRNNYDILFQCQ